MRARLRAWWQKIKQHAFIATGIMVVLIALIAFTFAIYKFGWDWTGFISGYSKITTTTTPNGTTTAKELQPGKTLWDWLGLLAALAIPLVVGLGAAWFTVQQGKVSDRENTDNQREAALQAYLDKMSKLLLKEHLGELTADGKLKPEYKQVRNVARVRTITALTQLNARRIGYVFAFLREAGLMSPTSNDNVMSLSGADLRAVNWSQANLSEANLSEANLSNADLSGANLHVANLSRANLSAANLSRAFLFHANLGGAILSVSMLDEVDLIANFHHISDTNFSEANLSAADLSAANLNGAIVTAEQLKEPKSLQDATMPDGSKHP